MQGETISSILCTSTVDKVAKKCTLNPFKYKKDIEIPKLGFVDDLLDINKCGVETKDMNIFTTTEINKRKMQFNGEKCVQMHIKSKKSSNGGKCQNVFIEGWKEETFEDKSKLKKRDVHIGQQTLKTVNHHLYLGDIIQNCGSNRMNVQSRAAKGQVVLRDIMHILEGTCYFEAMKLLRESMLMSVITNNLFSSVA